MKIIRSLAAVARACQKAPRPVVLVPTMGALHPGHLKLVSVARRLAGPEGTVVASIYVNPTQFGPKEDFSRYPRPIREDRARCRQAGVDLLFEPENLYKPDSSTWIDETLVSLPLCGGSRPGHFRGVCTVVGKLFHLIGPEIAVFGEKDAQQLAVIRRMVRDLHFPVRIVGVPTVREADGLALSSRNRYLSAEERSQAVVLSQALQLARQAASAPITPRQLAARLRRLIAKAPLARIDYAEVVDADTLQTPVAGTTRSWLVALAVFFGKTRLIDNVTLPAPRPRT